MRANARSGEFIRFLLSGGLSVVANYASRFFFQVFVDYPTAIVLAYLVGMVVAFLLMRIYAFKAGAGPWGPQIAKFALVNLVGGTQTLLISLYLAGTVLPAMGFNSHVDAIAHLIGLLALTIPSYLLHRLLTFRKPHSDR